MRSTLVAVCLCVTALGCGRVRYEQRACPSDTLQVGSDEAGPVFCIERVERGIEEQHLAEKNCWDIGRRLCSASEWTSACEQLGVAMVDSTDDFEWTSDRTGMLMDQAVQRGQGTCATASMAPILMTPGAYRCCLGR